MLMVIKKKDNDSRPLPESQLVIYPMLVVMRNDACVLFSYRIIRDVSTTLCAYDTIRQGSFSSEAVWLGWGTPARGKTLLYTEPSHYHVSGMTTWMTWSGLDEGRQVSIALLRLAASLPLRSKEEWEKIKGDFMGESVGMAFLSG